MALEGSHFENGERIRVKKDCSTGFISSLLFRSWGRRSGARDSVRPLLLGSAPPLLHFGF